MIPNVEGARQFKGVWVPKWIWEHPELTWMDKCLVAEIDSLSSDEQPCYASNAFLAGRFTISEKRLANMLTRLRTLKVIETVSFDGRRRELRVCNDGKADFPESGNRVHENREGRLPGIREHANSIGTSSENSKSKRVTGHSFTLPEVLNTPDFITLWIEWREHRASKRASLTPSTEGRQLAKLAEQGLEIATRTVKHSLEQGWTGLFETDADKKLLESKAPKKEKDYNAGRDRAVELWGEDRVHG